MKWPPWKKRAPKARPMKVLLRDALGSEIGTIYVDPNGKITGEFSSDPFKRKLDTAVKNGLIESVSLVANFTQKRPPWEV